MAHADSLRSSSNRLTLTIVGLMALIAVVATGFGIVYAVWWLLAFWAPF